MIGDASEKTVGVCGRSSDTYDITGECRMIALMVCVMRLAVHMVGLDAYMT